MNKEEYVDQLVTKDSSQNSSRDSSGAPRPELLESLSAMMDDEAESLEIRRVVKALESSPDSSGSAEMLGYWRRFHAARTAMQEPRLASRANVDLLAAVRAELAREAPVSGALLRRTSRFGRVLRVGGQGLIAATVAAAVLIAYPKFQGTKTQDVRVLTAQESGQAGDVMPQFSGDYNAAALTRTVSLDDAARRRLEKAVRNFSGTAAVLNSNSMPMFANQLEPFAPARGAVERPEPQK